MSAWRDNVNVRHYPENVLIKYRIGVYHGLPMLQLWWCYVVLDCLKIFQTYHVAF